MKASFLAAALAALTVGPAMAEVTVTPMLAYGEIRGPGGSEDHTTVGIEVKGRHASGIVYDLGIAGTDVAGNSVTGVRLEAGWLYQGVAGPAFAHEYARAGGVSSDRSLLGMRGHYKIASVGTISGSILSDIDAFGDDVSLRLAISRDLSDTIGLKAEYRHETIAQVGTNGLELGATYKLSKAAHLDARVNYARTEGGVSQRGIGLGIGFRF